MRDVAAHAAVSPMTVSRTLRGDPRVTPEMRERVLASVEALRYRRNDLARGLRTGRSSGLLGLVVTNLSNPFYSELALGHRRVGLLVTETEWTSDAGRVRGYRAAHEAAGVPLDERLVVRIPFHAPDTDARVDALLSDHRPTALFAANNLLADAAWHVLRRRRLRLPRDISLVAFDDVPWMEMVDPGITAVAQPTQELGRTAARLLLERLDDPGRARTLEVLQPALVVRGSTAAVQG